MTIMVAGVCGRTIIETLLEEAHAIKKFLSGSCWSLNIYPS